MSKQIAKKFNAAAFFHKEIAARLLSRLDFIRMQPQIIVELNCATGHCSRLLQKRYPKAQIFAIDKRIPLLSYARQKINRLKFWLKHPHFVAADLNDLSLPAHSVDIVIANLLEFPAIIDREQLHHVLQQWQALLKPGGLFIFTTFGPDTLVELKKSWAQVDAYSHVHNFLDMHDIGDALLQVGFCDPVMDREDFSLTYPNVPALLQDLKNLGLKNKMPDRKKGLTTQQQLFALKKYYDDFSDQENRIPATIEVIYAHAWAPTIKDKSEKQETHIPINAIKGRRVSG